MAHATFSFSLLDVAEGDDELVLRGSSTTTSQRRPDALARLMLPNTPQSQMASPLPAPACGGCYSPALGGRARPQTAGGCRGSQQDEDVLFASISSPTSPSKRPESAETRSKHSASTLRDPHAVPSVPRGDRLLLEAARGPSRLPASGRSSPTTGRPR